MLSGKIRVASIYKQTKVGNHDIETAVCPGGVKISSLRLQQESETRTVQSHCRDRAKGGSVRHPSKQDEEGGAQVSGLGQPASEKEAGQKNQHIICYESLKTYIQSSDHVMTPGKVLVVVPIQDGSARETDK